MMTEDDRLAISRRLASKTEQNSVRHRKYGLSEKSRKAWVGSGEKVTRSMPPSFFTPPLLSRYICYRTFLLTDF